MPNENVIQDAIICSICGHVLEMVVFRPERDGGSYARWTCPHCGSRLEVIVTGPQKSSVKEGG